MGKLRSTYLKGLDYIKFIEFIEFKMGNKNHAPFTKDDMKHLLTLAQSNHEREVIRHVFCQTSQQPLVNYMVGRT